MNKEEYYTNKEEFRLMCIECILETIEEMELLNQLNNSELLIIPIDGIKSLTEALSDIEKINDDDMSEYIRNLILRDDKDSKSQASKQMGLLLNFECKTTEEKNIIERLIENIVTRN